MESAYPYVRVSTDEQKRKGYSLPEQEDRLLKYCEFGGIEVKGIYREDFSAKNFNRPEWKKLITTIKKESAKAENNILFIKWDRFSRNILSSKKPSITFEVTTSYMGIRSCRERKVSTGRAISILTKMVFY